MNTLPSQVIIAVFAFFFSFVAKAAALPDFTDLVEKNTVSVVNISAIQSAGQFSGSQPNGIAFGSGFVISLDGDEYIITNNHVTQNANEILVRFRDRIEVEAELIGADTLTDVALLKVDTQDTKLHPVTIGNSENLKVGQWVAAIGSPFSFDYTVTAGIISALGRSLPDETYVPFIQSDVAVNQGNSGGPLFNLDGEVIGINSRIFSRTGTFAGLSFSIPIHIALDVARQLKEKGVVTRGFLGVSIRNVTRELVEAFGLKKATGALVVEVFKNSSADDGGIKNGDIIIEYQGQEIINSGDLPVLVGRTKPGSKEKFVILRDGEKVELELVVGSRDGDSLTTSNAKLPAELGMELEQLSDSQLLRLGLEYGVIITSIVPSGAAFASGFQAGDIITHYYQTPVMSIEEFYNLVSQARSGAHVPLRIIRSQRLPIYIALRIP